MLKGQINVQACLEIFLLLHLHLFHFSSAFYTSSTLLVFLQMQPPLSYSYVLPGAYLWFILCPASRCEHIQ